MPYLVKTNCVLETTSTDRSFTLLTRDELAGLEVDVATQYTVIVPANSTLDIASYGIIKVALVSAQSTESIDVCLSVDDEAKPIFADKGSNLYIRLCTSEEKSWNFSKLSIKNFNTTTQAVVKVMIAGYTA
jgi:hypothetical protein